MSFSVQTAAERILLSKAYQVYHFPVADGSSDANPTSSLEPSAVNENGNTNSPHFQPGSKVCLSYNRYPEPCVIIAVAYPPRSADTAASSSVPTTPVEDVTASLETATLSGPPAAETVATEVRTATAGNADTETANIAPVTELTSSVTAAAVTTTIKYLYLVLHNDTSKLKPSVDLNKAKVVYQEHIVNPPLYAIGRVLRFQIPISTDGDAVSLPVEIKKVVNHLGLDTMGGEPESKEWKYKFLHGTEWVPESALVVLDEMTSAGVLE